MAAKKKSIKPYDAVPLFLSQILSDCFPTCTMLTVLSFRPKGVVALVPDSKSRQTTPQKSPQKSRTKPKPQPKSRPPPPPPPRRRSSSGLFFGVLLRSCIIYSLYQYIWTCPKDGSDARIICDIGDHTLDFIEPPLYDAYDNYIEPYYTEYVSPYVNKATPYIAVAHDRYLYPSYTYAVTQFEQHGRPQLVKARQVAQAQYTRSLAPHVKVLENKGWELYDAHLADFVATGREKYAAYAPVAQQYAMQGYDFALEQVHPYYVTALPYLQTVWKQGIETAGWVGVEGKGWVARRWGMHVEPQLWRIQERLGLKGFAKNATPVKESEPTPPHHSNPNTSSSDIRPDANIESEDHPAAADSPNGQDGEESTGKSSAEQIAAVRDEVEGDLLSWATKFTDAATAASDTVVSKLNVLCDKVMKEQATLSADVLKELNTLVEREFFNFEDGVLKLIDSPAEHKYVMMGFDGLVGRSDGDLKRRINVVTEHTEAFLMDTYQNTAKIVDAALEEMDQVHDLGMQELGMKWAWMDGITYKDWQRYHDLKKEFPALKTKVIRSGQGHKGLREVTDYAKSINDAAKEVLSVAQAEMVKLEKLGRKRVSDAAMERENGASASASADANTAKNENDGKEVPQSDGKETKDRSSPTNKKPAKPPKNINRPKPPQNQNTNPSPNQRPKLKPKGQSLKPKPSSPSQSPNRKPDTQSPSQKSTSQSQSQRPINPSQKPSSQSQKSQQNPQNPPLKSKSGQQNLKPNDPSQKKRNPNSPPQRKNASQNPKLKKNPSARPNSPNLKPDNPQQQRPNPNQNPSQNHNPKKLKPRPAAIPPQNPLKNHP
ncbi:hypothetical protein Dda_1904 [Drechslerella dactyloides]|uniref:Uncharacterized protein n=1 Tax=Drechslerella dactyloides TaxID=74499 RepID=A0AAD6J6T8_DREDA|nr:hypothetical protein Dda_1904 [Drechslerella dactyloides]